MINEIIAITKEAGKAILEIYEKNITVTYKEDTSPLTLADTTAHKIISEKLKKFGYPIISEEAEVPAFEERSTWDSFWLVDPLDGTKEFIKKTGECTVNIALITNNKPVLGVVHVPVTGETYYAEKGKGAFRDGVKLPATSTKVHTIIASVSHRGEEDEAFIKNIKKKDTILISKGSSLKMCLVAEGAADVYPRFIPSMEWDIAAAHCIVNEAGKHIIDQVTKKELSYNKKDLRNNSFVCE
jgi:3'(2'), 5'-bisphosphate nucleotidase